MKILKLQKRPLSSPPASGQCTCKIWSGAFLALPVGWKKLCIGLFRLCSKLLTIYMYIYVCHTLARHISGAFYRLDMYIYVYGLYVSTFMYVQNLVRSIFGSSCRPDKCQYLILFRLCL
jgi:hypothetical protein